MIGVLFEATANAQHQPRYLTLAADLRPLLDNVEGFISIERFQSLTTPEKILSLSWWVDETAVLRWKHNPHHLAAQQEGRQQIFADYRIRIVEVLRGYSSDTSDHGEPDHV